MQVRFMIEDSGPGRCRLLQQVRIVIRKIQLALLKDCIVFYKKKIVIMKKELTKSITHHQPKCNVTIVVGLIEYKMS